VVTSTIGGQDAGQDAGFEIRSVYGEEEYVGYRDVRAHARQFDCVLGITAMKRRISETQESLAGQGGLSP